VKPPPATICLVIDALGTPVSKPLQGLADARHERKRLAALAPMRGPYKVAKYDLRKPPNETRPAIVLPENPGRKTK
jgi:hypothetical protein